MLDYEKLEVYQKARGLNKQIFLRIVSDHDIDPYFRDQIKRATISILLNLSEGSGRESLPDKKHFFIMAKSSCLEVSSVLLIISDIYSDKRKIVDELYPFTVEVVKMISGLIRSLR